MNPIVLDLSRLLSRAARPAPTGIDRVEMAYARHLLATQRHRLIFAAMTEVGRFGPLPLAKAESFVAAMAARWRGDGKADLKRMGLALQAAAALAGEGSLHRKLRRSGGVPRYLLVSHHHLDRPASIRRLKQATGAKFIPLVHDLIPLQHPQFAREKQPERHARRMRAVAGLADAVIVNSAATGEALTSLLEKRDLPVVVSHIGFEPPRLSADTAAEPYFVCIGTIEPRKNHLLLLSLWKRLGKAAPRLHLVGRRGWRTEGIVDVLDDLGPLEGMVIEHKGLSDEAMERLLIGARALLFPALAEGFGLPLAEALARGVPAIVSDLPALREVGGAVPEYLDPRDAGAWRQAVLDFADLVHPRRTAQLQRLKTWDAPTWDAHFAAVAPLLG